jgi:hypothetical protein
MKWNNFSVTINTQDNLLKFSLNDVTEERKLNNLSLQKGSYVVILGIQNGYFFYSLGHANLNESFKGSLSSLVVHSDVDKSYLQPIEDKHKDISHEETIIRPLCSLKEIYEWKPCDKYHRATVKLQNTHERKKVY